jgi:outer membrane receptor protein involved in Fe transport
MRVNPGGSFLSPFILTLACLSSSLIAGGFTDEEGESAAEEVRVLETVQVTATRSEQSIYAVSEAVTVIDTEAINRKAPELLAEMLRGVPGAYFQQTTPGQGIPIIRGLKGSQVLHLVDGMRLNNAFFRNAPNQYLGLVDAYMTDKMEVVRGSAPSLYGADAMGGVVQVLSAEPDFSGTEWQGEGRFYGSFNSVDNSFVARAQAATGKYGSSLSGGLTYQDHSDRKVGGGGKVNPSAYTVSAADVKWRQALGTSSEIMLSAQFLEQPSTPRVDELVPGFGQDHPSSEQYEFKPNRREFLHARYRLESDSTWFSHFEAHLARQVITDDRLTQDYNDSKIVQEFNESKLDGLTLQFNSPWSSGQTHREMVWGFEYYKDEVTSSRIRTDSSADSGSSVGELPRGRFPDRSTMDSAALYASSEWHWDALTVRAGLRYSWFEIFLPATEEVAAVRLKPDDLTGDIHFNYEIKPGLHLVSNIGRGFRPPNIFDLGTLGSRPGNRFNIPNADLKPESVWSYDLGIKSGGSRWEAELFLFYSDYRDKISSRFTGELTEDGRFIVRSDNLNKVQLWGIESGLRYLFNDEVELYAVINYTRGEESITNDMTAPADRIPPLNGRLGFTFNPGHGLRLEPYVDFAGEQDRLSPRDVSDPRINPTGTSGWATFNLLLSWQTSQRLELGLRLENLADKNYREHGSGIDAPGRNLGIWFNARF